MQATIVIDVIIDAMGALHAWKGAHQVEWEGKYRPLADGREADLYVQDSQDVETILAYLPDELADETREGWTVVCDLPDELFPDREGDER